MKVRVQIYSQINLTIFVSEKFKHKLSTIIIASENGHTNVLEWFKNNDNNNNNESDFKNYDIT